MIFSSIYAQCEVGNYPKALQIALEYLQAHDFAAMEPGVYELQGSKMYAQVFDIVTASLGEKKPEAHEKYIDVQFLASGRERLGVVPNTGNYEVAERFEEKDLIFYHSVENESFVEAVPGCYSIFFPSDIHRPAVAAGEPMTVRKVIVKVSVDLLQEESFG